MKSHVSDLLELATCIYYDAVAKCTDVLPEVRDLLTLSSRVEHEGISFLTITLPTLGKEFDLSLARGWLDSTFFRSFRKKGKAPAFLQGFFSLVFDEAGRIKNEPSIEAIEGIRQITYAFKKLKIACSPNRVNKAITKFRLSEHIFEESISQTDLEIFHKVSRAIWSGIFVDKICSVDKTIPKHGPGATAERLSGNAKFLADRWHERLEPYFPILDFAFANADARLSREFQRVTLVTEEHEQPVRVIPVPKTLKTPRIIAIEPVCMQYSQQALSREIVSLLETHPLTEAM
jgi:hypothetical protein